MKKTSKPKPQCKWKVGEYGVWETTCGNSFVLETDGPEENGFKFCPYCGRELKSK